MSSKAPIIVGGITAGCALIVIIILLACSFSKVEMTEVGLLYSHASRTIDRSQLYTAGRYYVGVGGEFITYPITQQELVLPTFESRTMDGLKISLDVSINFKVEKDSVQKILRLFDNFGYHYDGYISRLAMNIIRDASAGFTAFEYSQNRSLISQEMERQISDDMSEMGFSLDSVQLLNVAFPDKFSNALQNTLLLQQQVTQAEMEKVAQEVALKGELTKSDITAQGILTEAETMNTTIRENADAQSQSLIASLESEAESHINMIIFFKELAANESKPESDAIKNFVNWYWMNQMSNAAASKNVAIGIPKDLEIPNV